MTLKDTDRQSLWSSYSVLMDTLHDLRLEYVLTDSCLSKTKIAYELKRCEERLKAVNRDLRHYEISGERCEKTISNLPVRSGFELFLNDTVERSVKQGFVSILDDLYFLAGDVSRLERYSVSKADVLLVQALVSQKFGSLDLALPLLDKFDWASEYDIDSLQFQNYLGCKAKILTQQNVNPEGLGDYYKLGGSDLKKSLLWRESLMRLPAERSKSLSLLSHHEEVAGDSFYQQAHQYWCKSFCTYFIHEASNESEIFMYLDDLHSQLFNSFLLYRKAPGFYYKEKCLGSNIILLALLQRSKGNFTKYYELLFYVRDLYRRMRVKPFHEAMPELLVLFSLISADIQQIVFEEDIWRFVRGHKKAHLIRDAYFSHKELVESRKIDFDFFSEYQDIFLDLALK